MARFVDRLKAKWRVWAKPLLTATPKERFHWFVYTLAFGALAVSAEVWVYDNYRIAWDRQTLRCLDASFLLVDLKDKELVKDKIYAYESRQAAPVIKNGELVGKYLRGVPGDTVEIRHDNGVYINGQKIAQGMPHLRGMTEEQAQKFYGKRVLKDNEYWMMGTKYLSFDSRYWGPIHKEQIVARAYALF
ncbi:MAG: S26 family signal peptidase [Sutterellaceae bacterium]|nr:S26 family signal peptidase [Sutterellaceae bacterium]